jgi:putative hydrolase of HD superfamily
MPLPTSHLNPELAFSLEIDRLKGVERRTELADRSRRENSAEHSWHVATMALVFAAHAPPGTDVDRVVRMLLVHDLVEIDAGDTFAFDVAGLADRESRETAAATRLFGMLPDGGRFRALWEEFDAGVTPDARYANALDRLAPLLLNVAAEGGTWREHRIGRSAVLRRVEPIRTGIPALWPLVLETIEQAMAAGWVAPD